MDIDVLFQQGSTVLIRLISAIVVLLLGLIIGKLAGRFIQKALIELELNALFRDLTDIRLPLDRYAGTASSYIIYAIAIVLALQQLRIITSVLYLVAGTMTLLLIATLAVSIKDFFPNAIASLSLRRKFKAGSALRYKSMMLSVKTIGLLETETTNSKGEILFFPNAQLLRITQMQEPKRKKR